MNPRELGFWTLQSAAIGLLIAGGGWGVYRMSAPPEEDIAVVRTPFAQNQKDSSDLSWSIRHEGIADAVRDSRPDPYVPSEPAFAAPEPVLETEPEEAPVPEVAVAKATPEPSWATPLAAALKAKPRRTPPTRSVLKMISLGPASSGFSVGASASYAAPAAVPESAAPTQRAAAAETSAPEPQAARRAVPLRRAFVSAGPSPSAPAGGTAVINQPATDYGETETAPD